MSPRCVILPVTVGFPAYIRIISAIGKVRPICWLRYIATIGWMATGLGASERDGFLREGGIIALVVRNRNVRFDINQHAAANELLRVSARLLNVARAVPENNCALRVNIHA